MCRPRRDRTAMSRASAPVRALTIAFPPQHGRPMDTLDLFQRLALALAIGLIIGLERGWKTRAEPEGQRAAGLRTNALAGLLGGVWGAIAARLDSGGGIALGLAFLVFGGAIVLFRYREAVHEQTFGATTAVAALLAFALGAYAVLGDMSAAAAAGVAAVALLALKQALHAWVRRVTWLELRSGILLGAMTFILLPLLPNRTIDPLGAINPFEIWLLTVMIAAISFMGYIAIKLAGDRLGIALTGMAGGLASSTAVTLTLARLAPRYPTQTRLLAGGALIAGATMMVRVGALVAAANAALLTHLALPLLLGAATMGLAAFAMIARPAAGERAEGEPIALSNPLDLAYVLRFGALLMLIGVLAWAATRLAGTSGAYILAALSGIADVDAIALTMARLTGGSLAPSAAATAVLIAVVVNTGAKAVLGWSEGGARFGSSMALVGLAALAAMAVGVWLGPLPIERLLAAPTPR